MAPLPCCMGCGKKGGPGGTIPMPWARIVQVLDGRLVTVGFECVECFRAGLAPAA